MTTVGTLRVSERQRALRFLLPTLLIMGAINQCSFINGIIRLLHPFRNLSWNELSLSLIVNRAAERLFALPAFLSRFLGVGDIVRWSPLSAATLPCQY
ncbi:hypothetical protein KAH43_06275 [Candidatus Bipolaricaulota bacterium]|nr:hypothetical protein [Candidatus Bipolaricaulota bacterium]